ITSAGSGKGGDLGGLAGARPHCPQLPQAGRARGQTLRAFFHTQPAPPGGAGNAPDPLGQWSGQKPQGTRNSTRLAPPPTPNNKIGRETALDEKGQPVKMRGETPNQHDMLTGSDLEGKAFPGNLNLTCNNWTSGNFGSAMLGHVDREGIADTVYQKSWVSSHM